MGRRTTGLSFYADATWHGWERDLKHFEIDESALREWQLVTEVFFDRTQSYAHVDTGDMKSSGRHAAFIEDMTIVGEISYNGFVDGRVVDYTQYEVGRGGSHDFFTQALNATDEMFRDAGRKAIAAQIAKNLWKH
jgi:hypothetical protein